MIIVTFFFSSTTQCRIIKAFLVHNIDILCIYVYMCNVITHRDD